MEELIQPSHIILSMLATKEISFSQVMDTLVKLEPFLNCPDTVRVLLIGGKFSEFCHFLQTTSRIKIAT